MAIMERPAAIETDEAETLHAAHQALAKCRREKEAVWGEYLKLCDREGRLVEQAERLVDQVAREALGRRPPVFETKPFRPPKVQPGRCRSCNVRLGKLAQGDMCGHCAVELEIIDLMEEAENG